MGIMELEWTEKSCYVKYKKLVLHLPQANLQRCFKGLLGLVTFKK